MRRILPALVLVFMIVVFASCEKYTIISPEVDYTSFSSSLQPIFDADCISCHSGGINPNLSSGSSFVSLTTGDYIDLDEPENSKIYTKLQGSHKSYTLDVNKEIILAWIIAGAPND